MSSENLSIFPKARIEQLEQELSNVKEYNNQLQASLKIAKNKTQEMMSMCIQAEDRHKFILNSYNKLKNHTDKELNERENVMLDMVETINELIKYKEEKEEIEALNKHIEQVVEKYLQKRNTVEIDQSNEAFKNNFNSNLKKLTNLEYEAFKGSNKSESTDEDSEDSESDSTEDSESDSSVEDFEADLKKKSAFVAKLKSFDLSKVKKLIPKRPLEK